MRALSAQRPLARERQGAVILLGRQRQAKLDAAERGVLAFRGFFFVGDFFGLTGRLFGLGRRARRSAKLFKFELVISRWQSPRQSDIPVIGARLQTFDQIASTIFQHADGFGVSEARKVDDAVLRQRKIDARRGFDGAGRIRLQFFRVERNLVVEAIVMGEASRLDEVVACRQFRFERPARSNLADAFLLASKNLANHAVAD